MRRVIPTGITRQRVKEPPNRQNRHQIMLHFAPLWQCDPRKQFDHNLFRICPCPGCFDLLRDPNSTVPLYADEFGSHRLCGPFDRCQTVKKQVF